MGNISPTGDFFALTWLFPSISEAFDAAWDVLIKTVRPRHEN
jgi:hypothetical protein